MIFENDIDKDSITKFNEKYKKDWQDLIYIVDVEAIKIQDVIRTYKILKVYMEDTIDPAEDNIGLFNNDEQNNKRQQG